MISGRKTGAVVRAFFAVGLPDAVRSTCAELARELRSRPNGDAVRWVRPEGYHLTLRFLGNVGREAVPALVTCAGEELAGTEPFVAKLASPHVFPSARQPRVVALVVEPEAPLAELAARVEAAVTRAGLDPERRRFRAHLTLGRVRNRRTPCLDGAAPTGESEIPVRELALYRSDLDRDGAVYTLLDRIPLGGQTAPGMSSP